MKNNMMDLQNYLFESIERLQDDSLSDDELEKELKRAKGVSDIAANIISLHQTSLQAAKFMSEFGAFDSGKSSPVLTLIGGTTQDE